MGRWRAGRIGKDFDTSVGATVARNKLKMNTHRWQLVGLAALAVATFAMIGFLFLRPDPAPAPAAAASEVPRAMPTLKPVPKLLVIGDSYSGGSNEGGNKLNGWPVLAQTAVTRDGSRLDMILEARGGSGYVNVGPTGETFIQALQTAPRPVQAVLVFGSINDQRKPVQQVADAARALYADIKAKSPDAKLIVVGPAWMRDNPPADILAINDALREVATEAGAQFVDPLTDGWFTGPDAELIGADGTHPTDAGHVYMANKLAPVISEVMKDASKP